MKLILQTGGAAMVSGKLGAVRAMEFTMEATTALGS